MDSVRFARKTKSGFCACVVTFKWTRSVSRERRNLVSAHVSSHFKRALPDYDSQRAAFRLWTVKKLSQILRNITPNFVTSVRHSIHPSAWRNTAPTVNGRDVSYKCVTGNYTKFSDKYKLGFKKKTIFLRRLSESLLSSNFFRIHSVQEIVIHNMRNIFPRILSLFTR